MRLSDYLLERGESVPTFARRAGVSLAVVQKVLREERLSSESVMLRIYQATDGAVTSADYPAKRRGK